MFSFRSPSFPFPLASRLHYKCLRWIIIFLAWKGSLFDNCASEPAGLRWEFLFPTENSSQRIFSSPSPYFRKLQTRPNSTAVLLMECHRLNLFKTAIFTFTCKFENIFVLIINYYVLNGLRRPADNLNNSFYLNFTPFLLRCKFDIWLHIKILFLFTPASVKYLTELDEKIKM